MMKILILFQTILCFVTTSFSQNPNAQECEYSGISLQLYPAKLKYKPELPSPCIMDDGTEVLIASTTFNDEILGMFHLEMWREPDQEEIKFLKKKFRNLSEDDFKGLIKKLSYIHTGEMVPYYIMRYGFYEGDTEFRADPRAIAFIFSLTDLQKMAVKEFISDLDISDKRY